MESKITTKLRMEDRIMLVHISIGRIDGAHCHVKTQNEIIEIQTESKAIGHSQLLVERIELKLPARLVYIVSQCPNVTCIYKSRTIKLPKQICSILYIQI